jgi:formate dehydrogenase subunit delta
MIDEIAVQFGHLSPDRAAEETAHHVRTFWAPMMLTRLIDLAVGGAAGPAPVANAAVRLGAGHGDTRLPRAPTAASSPSGRPTVASRWTWLLHNRCKGCGTRSVSTRAADPAPTLEQQSSR